MPKKSKADAMFGELDKATVPPKSKNFSTREVFKGKEARKVRDSMKGPSNAFKELDAAKPKEPKIPKTRFYQPNG